MNNAKLTLKIAVITSVAALSSAQAEVVSHQINAENVIVHVSDESWQPDGFKNGTTIPAAYQRDPVIVIDGRDDEKEWQTAREIEVPLDYGPVKSAFLKAVYSDKEVFIRVRWADDDEDRQYRPWVWSPEQNRYVTGPQLEDSVLLSFEAGCEWQPSLLAGQIYDFDGWQWLAARSDPLGQAVDLYGNVQDQVMGPGLVEYQSRELRQPWNVKFTENASPNLYSPWDGLDRVYMLQPFISTVYVQAVPDGRNPPPFFEQVTAPSTPPETASSADLVPQFVPVKLTEGAGEVSARGHWKDGYWTVEFRRDRVTPATTLNDTVFNRLVQFSVNVFDHAEKLDEASESDRLFLQFMPADSQLAKE